jgi:hypothetical protein
MTAFMSKPGFKPVKHLNGSAYNGQANMYVVGGAVTLVPGDVVMLEGTGHASGLSTVTIAAATSVPVGVVVGVINTKFDPLLGKMTTGAVSLDTPQTATQGSYILVADAPDLICETEIATYAQADVNLNFELVPTTYNTTTGASNMKIIQNGNTQADPYRMIGVVQRDDYVSGSTYARPVDGDTNVKVLVTFNTHQYKGSTGVAGV